MNPLNQCTCTQQDLQKVGIPARKRLALCSCNVWFIIGLFWFWCKDNNLLHIFKINMQ